MIYSRNFLFQIKILQDTNVFLKCRNTDLGLTDDGKKLLNTFITEILFLRKKALTQYFKSHSVSRSLKIDFSACIKLTKRQKQTHIYAS